MTQRIETQTIPPAIRQLLEEHQRRGALELPLLSDTAARVMALCNDENSEARDLAEVMKRDQSLAGHVLRVANSAAYAPKEEIVSLQQAISRLGLPTVREIALAISVKGRVFQVPGHQTRIRSMWMHSAAAAVYSREVALLLRVNAEGAFMCGLLHDIGKPVVLQTLLDLVKERTNKAIPSGLIELAMDEFHEAWGALLVRSWDLPEWVGGVVEHHHHWNRAPEEIRREVLIARLGDMLSAWALDDSYDEADFRAEDDVVAELNIYADDLAGLLAQRGNVLEIAETFV